MTGRERQRGYSNLTYTLSWLPSFPDQSRVEFSKARRYEPWTKTFRDARFCARAQRQTSGLRISSLGRWKGRIRKRGRKRSLSNLHVACTSKLIFRYRAFFRYVMLSFELFIELLFCTRWCIFCRTCIAISVDSAPLRENQYTFAWFWTRKQILAKILQMSTKFSQNVAEFQWHWEEWSKYHNSHDIFWEFCWESWDLEKNERVQKRQNRSL